MNWNDAALGTAGIIGSCTATFHGLLVQRLRTLTALCRNTLPGWLRTDQRPAASAFSIRRHSDATASTGTDERGRISPIGARRSLILS